MDQNKNLTDGNEEMANFVNANSEAIQQVIDKAIKDPEYKQLLISSPDEALEAFELSEVARVMIKSLSAEDLEKLTPENINEYFSADSAIYTPDVDDAIELESSDENDI